jgi:hypothetical protein
MIMERQAWLENLKSGDVVLLTRPKKAPQEMYIRFIDENRIFMVPADDHKSDLSYGEVVWQDHGEGPFGEIIHPLDQGLVKKVVDTDVDS